MPRFSVAFGRRKSTADNLDNDVTAEPSFRVLDRSEVAPGKSFDGGASFAAKPHTYAKHSVSDIKVEDNLFADLKPQTNRGSGSSNTTKTISTDTSSRHSNVSTAASSADFSNHNDDQKIPHRKPVGDGPGHSGHKSTPSGFLKAAGRSFSFGGQKKPLPIVPNLDEPLPPPPVPPHSEDFGGVGRARAATSSTSTTVTPPKLDADFSLDLGGDFAKMFGFDKRASVMTVRGNEPNGRQSLGPRSLTGNRLNQPGPIPAPIQINKSAKVDAPPHSWGSQHSNEGLLTQSPAQASPINENAPTAVPRQPSPLSGRPLRPITSPETRKLSGFFGKRASPTEETEDEDAKLLKDSLSTVSKFMAGSSATAAVPKPKTGSRYRRDEDTLAKSEAKLTELELDDIGDDNLFDNSLAHSSRLANRFVARKPSPPRTKVMTPAQFERYRQDKERQSAAPDAEQPEDKSDDEEIDYDDDEDDIERAKQQAKQRRKQEAHMAVYRQQMMKVTGESSGGAPPSRPSLQMSFSTPNLPNMVDPSPAGKSDSDEDEEVPLAILAAHGFPNKARPPTRLSSMMSNPNLRASMQPSYQRPGSAAGDAPSGGNGRLPAFARKLPQDPFLGAGLVHNPVRESIAFGGGAPARGHPGPVPPGGLVGVIVNEERSRAMRRGSPHVDPHQPAAYDPIGGIPPHMLYQNNRASTMMTPGDQAQIQMTQQMQQFMQMQMQFMQMMAGQNGNAGVGPNGMPMGMNPNGANAAAMNNMMAMAGMGGPDMRHSYMGNGSVVDLPQRPESHSRSMSMVQPSSASWIQPPPTLNPGFAPSIHIQGVGYAPSIAPSERSNVGLPGRYRPVSHMPPAAGQEIPRSSTMSGALAAWDKQPSPTASVTPVPAGRKSGSGNASEDDDEEGWQAMKEKREKKRSMWKSKKGFGADIGALIN